MIQRRQRESMVRRAYKEMKKKRYIIQSQLRQKVGKRELLKTNSEMRFQSLVGQYFRMKLFEDTRRSFVVTQRKYIF